MASLINKIKGGKEEQDEKEVPLAEPKPVVMNGYLQKPTVGAAAAHAIRPIRSNVSSSSSMRPGQMNGTEKPAAPSRPVGKPEHAADPKAGPSPRVSSSVKAGAGKAVTSAGAKTAADSELPEMVKAQRELEKRMKYLEKEMKNLPNLDDEAPRL